MVKTEWWVVVSAQLNDLEEGTIFPAGDFDPDQVAHWQRIGVIRPATAEEAAPLIAARKQAEEEAAAEAKRQADEAAAEAKRQEEAAAAAEAKRQAEEEAEARRVEREARKAAKAGEAGEAQG